MSTYDDSLRQHKKVTALIDEQLARPNLTAEDILHLTVARRLNNLSDHGFAQALGGATEPALNFWGRR